MIHAIALRGAVAYAVQLTQQVHNAFEKAKVAQFLADGYASEGLEEKAALSRAECSAYRRMGEQEIGTVTDLLAWLAQHVEMSPIEQQTFNAAMLMSVDGTKPSSRPPAAKRDAKVNGIFDELEAYRNEFRERLLQLARLAKERGLELFVCRKTAVALEGFQADPSPFLLDAKIELDGLSELNPSQSAHPYKLFYVEYVRTNNKLRYPEAEAAKAYFALKMDKNERNERIANAGSKDQAIASFVRSFKNKLK